jgi:hypothetical protein
VSDTPDTFAEQFPRVAAAARWCAAIVVAGGLAAAAWLFVMQEGLDGQIVRSTWTEHDFAGGLGHALGGSKPAHTGLYATLAAGAGAALLFAAMERILPWQGWLRGIAFAPVLFLAWAFVFCPLVDARRIQEGAKFHYLPNGPFGADAGRATFLSAIAASLVAGVTIARVLPMVRDAAWWEAHPEASRRADHTGLLELPEERPEQGVERAG